MVAVGDEWRGVGGGSRGGVKGEGQRRGGVKDGAPSKAIYISCWLISFRDLYVRQFKMSLDIYKLLYFGYP